MSKTQRRAIFIFSLIIGGLLLLNSFMEAQREALPRFPRWEIAWGLFTDPIWLLSYQLKQPTLYLGIVAIGIGIFILKGGKP